MSHSLFPTIIYPTRVTKTSSTLLDNIFVNVLQFDMPSAILYNDLSDHFPVAIHMKSDILSSKEISVVKRVYDSRSIDKFIRYLNVMDWSSLYVLTDTVCDASNAYDYFHDIYIAAFENVSYLHV